MTRSTVGRVALLCLAGGCARGAAPAAEVASDTAAIASAIQARTTALAAAGISSNADSVTPFFTSDAVLQEPDVEAIGRDAIHAALQGAYATLAVTELVFQPASRIYGSDEVVEFGVYREVIKDRKSGTTSICDCLYSFHWRRDTMDSTWRVARVLTAPHFRPDTTQH